MMIPRPASSWLWSLGVGAGLLLACPGCNDSNAGAALPPLPRQAGWVAHSPDPVIQTGDFRSQGLWGDPCVLKVNGEYVMYLTSSTRDPFKPPVLPFRAVSPDGVKWELQPKQPLLTAEGMEYVSIETPSVVYFRGRYHMYFTAIMPDGRIPPMAIGHAVSDDGIKWTKDPEPVLRGTGNLSDWNGYLVAEPGAVVHDDRIHLYFCAVAARPGGKPPQLQTIGRVTTEDGVTFTPPERLVEQHALYPPEQGYVGYSTPFALSHRGRVHLFYDVAHFQAGRDPEWQQVALHHAVSSDGGKTFTQDPAPLLAREDFDWTAGEILAPSVLVEGDRLLLWFGGHVRNPDLAPLILRGFKGREFGVGLATTGVTWLERAP